LCYFSPPARKPVTPTSMYPSRETTQPSTPTPAHLPPPYAQPTVLPTDEPPTHDDSTDTGGIGYVKINIFLTNHYFSLFQIWKTINIPTPLNHPPQTLPLNVLFNVKTYQNIKTYFSILFYKRKKIKLKKSLGNTL